ncbi:MAG: thioredoxin family protein [Planctomycetota bacterium]|nr:thioredoxin family protein [Planctomycetota bacterium]
MNTCRKTAVVTNRDGRLVMPPVAGLVACALVCIGVVGCAGEEVPRLADAAQFKQVALQGGKPVLVDFYKGGCPTCIPLDGMMAALGEEYKDRVVFARFMLMTPFFAVTSPELEATYGISTYPVVILFVNGRETWRFLRDYNMNDYRKAIDEALAAPLVPRVSVTNGVPRR